MRKSACPIRLTAKLAAISSGIVGVCKRTAGMLGSFSEIELHAPASRSKSHSATLVFASGADRVPRSGDVGADDNERMLELLLVAFEEELDTESGVGAGGRKEADKNIVVVVDVFPSPVLVQESVGTNALVR